nr:SCO family protein [Bacillus sp. FJAT-27225]
MVAVCAMLLSACSKELDGAENWDLQEFTFTNQENEKFGTKDLEGKVWMTSFIFANCETVCPPMTANMVEIQKQAEEEGIENIHFVSFTVDPENDSPEVLKEYSEKFDVDLKNWDFLTGYEQEEIEQFALENFQLLVKKPESDDQVIHGTSFYLIGPDGKVKKYYSGVSDVPKDQIIEDIKKLQ